MMMKIMKNERKIKGGHGVVTSMAMFKIVKITRNYERHVIMNEVCYLPS